jgi:hypothetical protein
MVTPVESDELLVNLTAKSMVGPRSAETSPTLLQLAIPRPAQISLSVPKDSMSSAWNAMPTDPCMGAEAKEQIDNKNETQINTSSLRNSNKRSRDGHDKQLFKINLMAS